MKMKTVIEKSIYITQDSKGRNYLHIFGDIYLLD
jgi:hypothetical protein